ncbi:MAG: hypothetical protein J5529_00695 [Prevotella sp.]|nr:hypothetical protein [Prevotella sp.]
MGSELNKSVSPLRACLNRWRIYLLASSIAVLLGVVVSVSIPRTYAAQVKIADEHKETDLLLGLNTFAAWAKGALDDHEGLRQPEVYHKLVETREFAEEMSAVRVESLGTDYYHHISTHHREPWWERWFSPSESERERVIRIIRESIRSKAAALYGTVTLQVSDQDPVVAALLVDSVRTHLQRHMADYARDRSWRDLMDAEQKMSQAEEHYKSARDDYARFEDTHRDISSAKVQSVEDHLLKEYESAFNEYSNTVTQYRRAKALVDKFSYTFAVLKNATVPVKASAPFMPGYVMAFLFIAWVFTTWGVLLNEKISRRKRWR